MKKKSQVQESVAHMDESIVVGNLDHIQLPANEQILNALRPAHQDSQQGHELRRPQSRAQQVSILSAVIPQDGR